MRYAFRTTLLAGALAGATALGGCSTWDSMSNADKGTAIGAGTGAVLGNATVGGAAGMVGGAVVGGAAGRYIGKKQDKP